VSRLLQLGAIAVFCLGGALNAYAVEADAPSTADEVVGAVTDSLIGFVKVNIEAVESESEEYFTQVQTILEPAIDFESIAKSVMGRAHWTSTSDEQHQQFISLFKMGLVKTYGKGMAKFTDLDISVELARPHPDKSHISYVTQVVKDGTDVTKVLYTMRKDSLGWRVINVTLDSVNLGKISKSQFAQSVRDNNGNVGAAINSWGQ